MKNQEQNKKTSQIFSDSSGVRFDDKLTKMKEIFCSKQRHFQIPKAEKSLVECNIHGEYAAYKSKIPGTDKVVYSDCPKCEQEQIESDLKKEDYKRRQLLLQYNLGMSGIPKRFRSRSFDNYKVSDGNAGQAHAVDVCRRYSGNFQKVFLDGICLTMLGNVGNGKTHLACAIGNELVAKGHTVLFVGAYSVFSRIRATYRKDSEQSEMEVIESFVLPDLLILDEIGVQYGSDSESIWAHQIINRRYEEQKPTIIISNLTEEELGKYFGDRAMDRLAENKGVTIPFTWKSHRRIT